MIVSDIKTVLIVEDDPTMSSLMEMALKTEAYSCVKTDKIGDATLKLDNQKFACILLDMNLTSGATGEDIIKRIKRKNGSLNNDTPIIIVSGTLDAKRIAGVLKTVKHILIKPFTIEALIEKVQKAIHQK